MKICYEAEDGTRFDTEEECRDYEMLHEIVMLNSEGEVTDNCDHAMFVQLKSEQQEECACEEYGFEFQHRDGTFEAGWYMWVDEESYPIFTAINGSGWYLVDELNNMMIELVNDTYKEFDNFRNDTRYLSGN